MTEGLKEKTKKWGCYHCSCCRFYHGFAKGCELPRCAYILVSFAQQEIATQVEKAKDPLQIKINALQLAILSIYKPKSEGLERECGLQKQKLQQFPKLPKDPNTADRINHSIECLEWLEQFKELLK
jgi:hypothetical protein